MKENGEKQSLFVHILIMNVILIIVITFAYQGLSYRLIERSWKDTYLKYNESNIDLSINNIEREIIQEAVSIPSIYFLDIPTNSALMKPIRENIGSHYEDIGELEKSMDMIAKSNPDTYSVDVYYPLTDTIVTGFRSLHLDVDEDSRSQLIPWYEEFEKQDSESWLLSANRLNYPGRKEVLTYIARVPRYGVYAKKAIVAIHIDVNSFSEYLDSQYGSLMLVGDSGEILYDTEDTREADTISLIQKQIAQKDLTSGSEAFFIQMGNDGMMAIAKHSTILDVTYVYTLPMQGFYNDFKGIKNLLLWMGVVFIMMNIGAIVFMSRRSDKIYVKRIEHVISKVGINSPKKKGTVDDSIERLVVHITSLNSKIESSKPLLFQNTLRSLLFGQSKDGLEMLFKLPETAVRVFTVIIRIKQSGFQDNTALSEILNKGAAKMQPDYYFAFSSIEKEKIAVLVCCHECGQEENLAALHAFLKRVVDENICYTLTWGQEYDRSGTGISDSFSNTMQIDKYRFIFPEKEQLSYRDIDLEHVKAEGSHLKMIGQIERGIIGDNLLEVETKITYLISALRSGTYSIEYSMSTLRDLIAMMNRLIRSTDLNMLVIFGYDIRDYYNQISDITMFEEWAIYLCRIFIENKREKKKSGEVDLTEVISAFVAENIENDISLEMLADHLNLRTDTLSKMFKSAMGKSYSEYIRDIKMGYAEKLLLTTDDTVKEIAEKIGYSSIQYFIKTFKSTYGDTPHQYKKHKIQK